MVQYRLLIEYNLMTRMSKHKAKAPQRRVINRRNKIVRFLIVCEGEKTEPNYFKALIKDHYSDVLDVSIQGERTVYLQFDKGSTKKERRI